MTVIDWLIIGVAMFAGATGYARGLAVGAATLAGSLLGMLMGARLGAHLIDAGSSSPYAPLVALGGAALGAALLGGLAESLGLGVRRRLAARGLGPVDGAGGAVLGAVVVLALAWVAGAVALQTPGARSLRADIQRSAILRALNETLPPSGPVLRALARFDPLPALAGPRAPLQAPQAAIARAPAVRAAAGSIVRVRGTACGLGIEGSGWVAGRDGDAALVVTNAHVVAGQDDTTVELRGDGDGRPSVAVAFDPRNDVAVLRVEGMDAPALKLTGAVRAGTAGAILGFPQAGPYAVRAARVGRATTAISQDAYGRGPIARSITPLRGVIRPGNSGGPVVNADGRVLTTVFASARSGPAGGYGVPNAEVQEALDGARGEVSTGACAA